MRNGTSDYDIGRSAFLSRHPAANNWLKKNTMELCELDIQQILVIDFYGGSKNVSVKDYYNYKSEATSAVVSEIVSQKLSLTENSFSSPRNHAKVARDIVHNASKVPIVELLT